MKVKFATLVVNGTPRISMSREELLAMLNSLDREDRDNDRLIQFLEALDRELSHE